MVDGGDGVLRGEDDEDFGSHFGLIDLDSDYSEYFGNVWFKLKQGLGRGAGSFYMLQGTPRKSRPMSFI